MKKHLKRKIWRCPLKYWHLIYWEKPKLPKKKTGINYENQPTLYDEAKRSLKQINDEMCDSDKISASIGSIKLAPGFFGRVLRSPPAGRVY